MRLTITVDNEVLEAGADPGGECSGSEIVRRVWWEKGAFSAEPGGRWTAHEILPYVLRTPSC